MKCPVIAIICLIAGSCAAGQAPDQRSANEILDHALRLADAYNWVDAAPEFVAAERAFIVLGDDKNSYYAWLGKVRSTFAHGALPAATLQLANDLETKPFLQSDKRLRMFCLIVKGDWDGESDHAAMGDDWNEVRLLARDLGDEKWVSRATAQLGIAAYYDGDIQTARQDVGVALSGASSLGDKPGQMMALTILANGLIASNLYEQALPFADQAIKVASQDPQIGYPHVAHEARLLALIGTKQWTAAQRLADEMLAFARQGNGKALEAGVLASSASIARALHDDAEAIERLEEASRICQAGGYFGTLSRVQSQLTEIYIAEGNLPKAEEFAGLAAESTQYRGDFIALPARLYTLGRLQVEQGKYTEADQVFAQAAAFVDSMVGKAQGVLDKTALIATSSDVYRHHFALIADHFDDAAKGFDILEQVRGRVLSDLLAAGSTTPEAARRASRDAARLRIRLMTARSNAEVQRISQQLFLVEQSRWITPDMSILQAKPRERVKLAAVERMLPPSMVVLEYVMADPRSYCLVITRGGTRTVPLAAGSKLGRDIAAYLTAVKAKKPAMEEARALYEALLRPIHEVATHENLIIVRDGQLHLVPFDSFVDGAGKYIAETKVVQYAPSASTLYLLRQQKATVAGLGLLGVGGVPYDPDNLRKTNTTRGYDLTKLTNLPGSRSEVMAAAAAIPGPGSHLLLGADATESAFKREPLRRFRVLHLAVHGIANTAQPDRAALVLLSDPTAGEDGFLQASEIVHLRLGADLVVLSACDTGVGPIAGEEGTATLSRAFLLAGAKTVISTLWPIEDQSSLFLMEQFYLHLEEDEPTNRALTDAKRDAIQKFGRAVGPYYWAAFTIEGAGDRVRFQPQGKK